MKTGKNLDALKRILIVDDEDQTRTMVDRAIKKIWPKVQTAQASDGIYAVRIAEEFLPDILVLDLMLPGQDGFAVLHALKNNHKLKSSLVLGITAYNSPENITRLVKGGAISCLTKPFGPNDLKKWLSPYLGGDYIEEEFSSKKSSKSGHGGLLNLAAFLGLMVSTFQSPNDLKAASRQMSKTTQIEENVGKAALPFKRIAVIPFDSSNPYLSGSSFCDYLTVEILQRVKGIKMVERKDLMKILQEQKLSLTGILRSEKISQLGSILQVDAILIGSIQTLEPVNSVGGAISVTIKLMDVSTGQILWADRQKISHATWSVRELEEVAEALMAKSTQKIAKRMKSHFASLDRESS